jgi:hypothetical protein
MYCLVKNKSTKQWFKSGNWHRSNDLPAIEFSDGYKEYYNNGARYLFVKYDNGTKEYYDWQFKLHKNNFPAISYPNGDVEYWFHGRRHRTNGPAAIIGNKQYFFENGEFLRERKR